MQNISRRQFLRLSAVSGVTALMSGCVNAKNLSQRPNFVFILTDDQRHDAMSCTGNRHVNTPNLDSLAEHGVLFKNAFVTLSICSPSRAACLTGRYGSANGITIVSHKHKLNPGEKTFARILKDYGYTTGMVGKWHLGNTPQSCGFDYASYFISNGPQWNRKVNENGQTKTAPGFIEDYNADQSIKFINKASKKKASFVLFHCTQLVHMDHTFDWKPKPETFAKYNPDDMPVPDTYRDDLDTRPPYLKTARSRTRALEYGYDKKENIQLHLARYYAALEDTDSALGRIIQAVEDNGQQKNTYYIMMGDNGWLMGEHGFTSKVLAYEESIRVPMIIAGPGIKKTVDDHLVLNIDLMPTILELAKCKIPDNVHGRSLMPVVEDRSPNWRTSIFYECPKSALGVKPNFAVRTIRYKYIRTFTDETLKQVAFEELYDLHTDPAELKNLAGNPGFQDIKKEMIFRLQKHKEEIKAVY